MRKWLKSHGNSMECTNFFSMEASPTSSSSSSMALNILLTSFLFGEGSTSFLFLLSKTTVCLLVVSIALSAKAVLLPLLLLPLPLLSPMGKKKWAIAFCPFFCGCWSFWSCMLTPTLRFSLLDSSTRSFASVRQWMCVECMGRQN